ncbi:hypothetical protein FZEAL_3926 [Fusarium zealandicum]|uniref:Uncharacterized protein n=1 Tax=Fusarium zealandicum TaxID=1053134 RepID=A0A8H4UMQ0_9HYPO|nr:hypothetical protein FZEAL_3926 [Fusarium zealandicum]
MHFSKLILAVLPALALAEDTTTQTSTAVFTKTYYLSSVHTITATGFTTTTAVVELTTEVETSTMAETTSSAIVKSETSSFIPVANSTTHHATPKSTIAGTGSVVISATGGASEPTQVIDNGGSAVAAGKLAVAGVVGMVVAAIL